MARLTIAVLVAKCPKWEIVGGKRRTLLDIWVDLYNSAPSKVLANFEKRDDFREAVDWLEGELARRLG